MDVLKENFQETLHCDGFHFMYVYSFDIMPKGKQAFINFSESFRKERFSILFAKRIRGTPYDIGEPDDLDREIFWNKYLGEKPFLRWEFEPETHTLETQRGDSVSSKVRVHVTIFSSGILLVSLSVCLLKEKVYEKLKARAKENVTLLSGSPSLADLLSFERYGFDKQDNPLARRAEEIHHEILSKLYGWKDPYEDQIKRIRSEFSDCTFVTTILCNGKGNPKTFWENHVYDILSLVNYSEDWIEIPDEERITRLSEWKKEREEAEQRKINWIVKGCSLNNCIVVGAAGFLHCLFGEVNFECFANCAFFHPLGRLVILFEHQSILSKVFEAIATSKTKEILRAWPPKTGTLDDLLVLRLQAEMTLDQHIRIDDSIKSAEVDELSDWINVYWHLKEDFKRLEKRLEDLAELEMTINPVIQSRFFERISASITVLGLAGIFSFFAHWIVTGKPTLEEIRLVLILSFVPVLFIMIPVFFILRKPHAKKRKRAA